MPFPYYAEVLTGLEYTAASNDDLRRAWCHEGIECITNIRARYDGERRNPWDEAECGSTTRARWPAWSGVLALSGFRYDGPDGACPALPGLPVAGFRCFWSTATGWGTFAYGPGGRVAAPQGAARQLSCRALIAVDGSGAAPARDARTGSVAARGRADRAGRAEVTLDPPLTLAGRGCRNSCCHERAHVRRRWRDARRRQDDAHSRRGAAAAVAGPPRRRRHQRSGPRTRRHRAGPRGARARGRGGRWMLLLPAVRSAERRRRAGSGMRPDVIFAEPVGSCLDLAATVLRPVLRDEAAPFPVAPLTVLVDPARARQLAGTRMSDLAYLFRHQLDEADIVCLTKSDAGVRAARVVGPSFSSGILDGVAGHASARRRGRVSSPWLDHVLAPSASAGSGLELPWTTRGTPRPRLR